MCVPGQASVMTKLLGWVALRAVTRAGSAGGVACIRRRCCALAFAFRISGFQVWGCSEAEFVGIFFPVCGVAVPKCVGWKWEENGDWVTSPKQQVLLGGGCSVPSFAGEWWD